MLLMTPGPTNVSSRVIEAMSRTIINHRSQEFRDLYSNIEDNIKYTFQTKNEVFFLTSSGTGGVECAISNVVSRGDKILIPVNGDFSERLTQSIKIFGGKPIEIPVEWGASVTSDEIHKAMEKERDLKAIAVVYNETSTGAVTRCLEEIGRLTEKSGLILIVDAVSALAGEELPVDDWNIDLCVTCSHKAIAAPPGLAMISVSNKAWKVVEEIDTGRYYFDLKKFRTFHEHDETPFTPAVSTFYALDEALKMLREEGLEKRITRHEVCAKAFYDAIEAMGLEPLANKMDRSNTVIAIKNPPNIDDRDIRNKMLLEHGIAISGGMGKLRGTTFRIGSMGVVSKKEVIATISALEATLISLGMCLEKGLGAQVVEEVFS